MRVLVRHIVSLFLCLVVLLTRAGAAANAAECASSAGTPLELDVVEEAYNLLTVFFVEPVAPSLLLSAAAQAISAELAVGPTASPEPVDQWGSLVDRYCALRGDRGEEELQSAPYAAVRAMTAAVDEGHTRFLTPSMYRDHQAETAGDVRYEGIGVRIRGGPLGVQYVFPGSPAEGAGLMFGDRIVAIDGEPAADIAVTDAVLLIRGEAGTVVRLTISRPGGPEPLDIEIVRASIRVPIVESRVIDEIGYLQIISFPGTGLLEEVAAALASFRSTGVEGLILDLRSNSGGRLDVGTRVAGFFLPEGTPLYRQTTRRGQVTTKAVASVTPWTKPVTVLIDDGTASMAEILAAGLQEQGVATLIGGTTAGIVAGSVVIPLSDGSAIQVTTLRLDSGLGRVLNTVGVVPDIGAEITVADARAGVDRPLNMAISHLRSLPRLRILVAESADQRPQ